MQSSSDFIILQTLQDGDLPKVLETISPMMNALRMVWVISKYYSDDTAMGSLMEKIAHQVQNLFLCSINLGGHYYYYCNTEYDVQCHLLFGITQC